jgi:hypothetical protein
MMSWPRPDKNAAFMMQQDREPPMPIRAEAAPRDLDHVEQEQPRPAADDAAPPTPTPNEAGEDGADPDETGGPKGPEPTRFGDWERKGRCIDF